MYGAILVNQTNKTLYATGTKGSDWMNGFAANVIPPGETKLLTCMSHPTQAVSDHWGWVFFSDEPNGTPIGQIYMAAGTDRYLYDYAVQPYDGGENRNGTTAQFTAVSQWRIENAGIFTIESGYLASIK
jgi:hypothetical protein